MGGRRRVALGRTNGGRPFLPRRNGGEGHRVLARCHCRYGQDVSVLFAASFANEALRIDAYRGDNYINFVHVLGLIDAGPFADYPSAHLAAAWEHATGCPTCGAARQAADAITAELTALPQPVPPSGLAELVMARITRIPEPLAADMSVPLRES